MMSPGKLACSLLLLLSVAGVACHTRVPPVAPARTAPSPSATPARPPAPPPPSRAAAPTATPPLSDAELFQRKSLDQLNAERPLGDVFFDYDQNTLLDEGRRTLQQDAAWLSRWPSTAVRVDGHCDERGTAEYNLALGDRRAEAVKAYLVSLGVRPERIEVRSLGKEAPFCNRDEESCWSQNRRGHFQVTRK